MRKGTYLQHTMKSVFSWSLFRKNKSAKSLLISHLFCVERWVSHPQVTKAAVGGGTPGTPERDATLTLGTRTVTGCSLVSQSSSTFIGGEYKGLNNMAASFKV